VRDAWCNVSGGSRADCVSLASMRLNEIPKTTGGLSACRHEMNRRVRNAKNEMTSVLSEEKTSTQSRISFGEISDNQQAFNR